MEGRWITFEAFKTAALARKARMGKGRYRLNIIHTPYFKFLLIVINGKVHQFMTGVKKGLAVISKRVTTPTLNRIAMMQAGKQTNS